MNDKMQTLTGLVGKGNVRDDAETLESYARDQSFVTPLKPWFVVKPKDAAEVVELVKWANRTQTPLVPVSSGPPRFNGDTVPGAPGAVIVDMSNFKRIIRMDRRNRVIAIEPGVTYGELQPALAKEGMWLPNPLTPKAGKSVVASLLERQPVLIPRYQWSIIDPLRCVEVVWGNGDKFMTGDAGNTGDLLGAWDQKHVPLNPSGPSQVDFMKLVSGAEGCMGIVTWAVLKCQVLPQYQKLCFASAQKLEDLLGFIYRILRYRYGEEVLLLNNADLASILGDSPAAIDALKAKLPPWMVLIGLAGGEIMAKEKAEYQEKDIREIAQSYGLQFVPAVPGARDGEVLDAILHPSREPYWKLNYKGNCQDIFFVTTLDKTPGFIKTMYAQAEAHHYSPADIGVYIQPVHQGTSCHCEFSLPFDPNNKAEVVKVKALFTAASEELLKQGAFFSRPYGLWANMTYNRDATSTAMLKKLKAIFDPRNVMNPGKLCF